MAQVRCRMMYLYPPGIQHGLLENPPPSWIIFQTIETFIWCGIMLCIQTCEVDRQREGTIQNWKWNKKTRMAMMTKNGLHRWTRKWTVFFGIWNCLNHFEPQPDGKNMSASGSVWNETCPDYEKLWGSFSSSNQLEKGRLGKSEVLTHLHISDHFGMYSQSFRKAFCQETALTRNRWECATHVARSHLARRCCWSFPSLPACYPFGWKFDQCQVVVKLRYHHLLMTNDRREMEHDGTWWNTPQNTGIALNKTSKRLLAHVTRDGARGNGMLP